MVWKMVKVVFSFLCSVAPTCLLAGVIAFIGHDVILSRWEEDNARSFGPDRTVQEALGDTMDLDVAATLTGEDAGVEIYNQLQSSVPYIMSP